MKKAKKALEQEKAHGRGTNVDLWYRLQMLYRARSMTLTVGFYFERYRFFPADVKVVDEVGPRNDITIPRDNVIEGVRDASELQVGIARTVQQLVVSQSHKYNY